MTVLSLNRMVQAFQFGKFSKYFLETKEELVYASVQNEQKAKIKRKTVERKTEWSKKLSTIKMP